MSSVRIIKNVFGTLRVVYECPHCKERLKSPLKDAGTSDSCPNCRARFIVPGADVLQREQARQQAEQERKRAEQQRELWEREVLAERRRQVELERARALEARRSRASSVDWGDLAKLLGTGVFIVTIVLFCLVGILSQDGTSGSSPSYSPSTGKPYDMPQEQWDYANNRVHRADPAASQRDVDKASRAIWEFEKQRRARGER